MLDESRIFRCEICGGSSFRVITDGCPENTGFVELECLGCGKRYVVWVTFETQEKFNIIDPDDIKYEIWAADEDG